MTDTAVRWVGAPDPAHLCVAGDLDTLRAWRESYRCRVPGAEHDPRFKRGKWDGTWIPGTPVAPTGQGTGLLTLPRGHAWRVARDFTLPPLGPGGAKYGYPLSASVDFHLKAHATALRDYQHDAVVQVLTTGWGRVAFATNAGKGAVIASCAAWCRSVLPDPALVLCAEQSVFDALQQELITWGVAPQDLGLVKAGANDPPSAPVVLAMIPTLSRRLEDPDWQAWLQSVGMVLVDEADQATAPTWEAVLQSCPNATWRAGFSGTFPQQDSYRDLRLEGLLGPVVARERNSDMIARGVSAKPTVLIAPYDPSATLTALKGGDGWWEATGPERRRFVFDACVTENADRHGAIAKLIQPNVPTAIIVSRIAHGEALAAAIPGAVFLDGSASPTARLEALEQFAQGQVSVLVVTKILDRGTNRLGSAQDLIFASGEGSETQTLQRVGRGLRRTDGKEYLRLVDVVDTVPNNAPMMADRNVWKSARSYFSKEARKRLELYSREGFPVQMLSTGALK